MSGHVGGAAIVSVIEVLLETRNGVNLWFVGVLELVAADCNLDRLVLPL